MTISLNSTLSNIPERLTMNLSDALPPKALLIKNDQPRGCEGRITLPVEFAVGVAVRFPTNQREMSSRGIGRFQFQGRASSRLDRHPTIPNPLANRQTSKQGIPVTDSPVGRGGR